MRFCFGIQEVFETMELLKMIIKLVNDNSEELFVIRPHPTESTEIYDFFRPSSIT